MEFQTVIAQHVINYEQEIDYNIGCVFDITPYKVPSTNYFISKLNISQNEKHCECLTKLKNILLIMSHQSFLYMSHL